MKASDQIHSFSFPTQIFSGPGASKGVPDYLKSISVERPLVVTDKGIAELGWFREFCSDIKKQFPTTRVYSEIFGNPVKSQVTNGVNAVKDLNADSIVAIGGGAALDVAKGIALMAHHPGDLFDYEDGDPDALPIDKEIPKLIALPTTAGTGSEVGRSGVVSDDETKQKKIFFSPRLLPEAVFADPVLTLGLPPLMTAATGLDALTHLIEAYISRGHHPICEGIAVEGVRIVGKYLPTAYEFSKSQDSSSDHLEARAQMLNAAMMGAIAFQKGLGVTHSCAHALSTVCDLHHGLANGILLPYTMKFNMSVCQDQFLNLARVLNPKADRAEDLIEQLVQFNQRLEIPTHLQSQGVKTDHIPRLVEVALKDVCHPLNPREVSQSDFEKLFEEAISG